MNKKDIAPARRPLGGLVRGLLEEGITMEGSRFISRDPSSFETLSRLLSMDRFATFIRAAGGSHERALRLYAWNIEISSAFWGSFHILEASLRNALHQELTKMANQEDWWNARLPLHTQTMKDVHTAVALATQKHKKSLTIGHVVAELNLACWSGMLANRYQKSLWEGSLIYAFPHYTGRRGALHDDLERLRMLRNRIAHHEPIFERNLALDHDMLCGLLGYIEPEATAWVKKHSQVSAIIGMKEGRLSGELESSF